MRAARVSQNSKVAVGQLNNELKLTIKLHKVEESWRFGRFITMSDTFYFVTVFSHCHLIPFSHKNTDYRCFKHNRVFSFWSWTHLHIARPEARTERWKTGRCGQTEWRGFLCKPAHLWWSQKKSFHIRLFTCLFRLGEGWVPSFTTYYASSEVYQWTNTGNHLLCVLLLEFLLQRNASRKFEENTLLSTTMHSVIIFRAAICLFSLLNLNFWSIKCQEVVKSDRYNLCKPKVTFSNVLFWPTNTQKPEDI